VDQVCVPSPPLRRLHQQLLTTDAALDFPVTAGPDPVPLAAAVAVRRRRGHGVTGRTGEGGAMDAEFGDGYPQP
jgi:hypothetical protein